MNGRLRGITALLLTAILALTLPGAALAKDNTGNVFFNGDQYLQEGAVTQRDLVWAGSDVQFDKIDVGQDALLAGQSIEFTDSKVGGSVRAASQRLSLSGVEVGSNVTAAAQQIIYGTGSKAVGTYFAAQTIYFEGTSKGGSLFAQKVNVTGKVDGDLRVFADEVTFGAGAQVTGTCYVVASSAPSVDPKAQVNDLQFTQSELRQDTEQAVREAGGALATGAIVANVMSVVWTLLLAVVLLLVTPKLGERIASAYRKRTGATIATGALAFFLLPLVALILTVLVVTLPVAGLLGLFMLAGPLFAPAVTGIGLGKLAFKNMNRWASGLLGAVIVSVLLLIPMIKWLVGMLCLMFATGYVLQALWQHDRSGRADSGVGPANGPESFAENPNASVYGNAQTVPPEGL